MAQRSLIIREAIGICEACRSEGAEVRVFGGVAASIVGGGWFQRHPEYTRVPGDIDLVGFKKDLGVLRAVLLRRGYREAKQVASETEGQRALFGGDDLTVDFAGDELDFCQRIDVRRRLELSYPTLSLTDLILEKLQIVAPADRQLVDFVALVSSADQSDIDVPYLWKILGRHWGFWYSAQHFLRRVRTYALTANIQDADENLTYLEEAVARTPRGLLWRVRSWLGTAIPWHAPVEPLRQHERRVEEGHW